MVNKVLQRKAQKSKQYISIRCVSDFLSTFLMIVWNELRDENKLQKSQFGDNTAFTQNDSNSSTKLFAVQNGERLWRWDVRPV